MLGLASRFTQVVIYIALKLSEVVLTAEHCFTQVVIYIALKPTGA